MLYEEFEKKLENALYEMDSDEYLSLVETMGFEYASDTFPIEEFDDQLDDLSPSELYELFEESDVDLSDSYFIYDGYHLETFDSPQDRFDVYEAMEYIETRNNSYGNTTIQELLDEYHSINEDEVLDKILEALENKQSVKIVIDDEEYNVIPKTEDEKEDEGDE